VAEGLKRRGTVYQSALDVVSPTLMVSHAMLWRS
jgi:hypothetical protein